MKVQISPKKFIADALCVWHTLLPDTDIVIDPRPPYGVRMQPGSVKNLYVFGVLGITPSSKHQEMVDGWIQMLAPGGVLYIIENDFDYLSRAVVHGDLPLSEFNKEFIQPSYVNKDQVIDLLIKAGCPEGTQRQWKPEGLKFEVTPYQFIISADKK